MWEDSGDVLGDLEVAFAGGGGHRWRVVSHEAVFAGANGGLGLVAAEWSHDDCEVVL